MVNIAVESPQHPFATYSDVSQPAKNSVAYLKK
jgi:hypothetical protein